MYFLIMHLLSWLEVQGSILTDGARALAKHVDRSSNKYWGCFDGSGEHRFIYIQVVLTKKIHYFLMPVAQCC